MDHTHGTHKKTEEQLIDELVASLNNIKRGHITALDALVHLGSMTTKKAGEHDWAFMAGLLSSSGKAIEEISEFLTNLEITHFEKSPPGARDQEAGDAEAPAVQSSVETEGESESRKGGGRGE